MNATYADDTVDEWTSYYEESNYERLAYIGRDAMPELLHRFFERFGTPRDFASIGCGPAFAEFELAARHPEVEFYGYDIAEAVVRDNVAHAEAEGRDNMHFAVDSLPNLQTDREFDLVYCLATLYFVDDVDRAVQSLYDHVRDGGYLVFNYPNRYTMKQFDEVFEGQRRELFSRVIEGKNLLSYDKVRSLLGATPRSYWSAVDGESLDFVTRETPCVYVRK